MACYLSDQGQDAIAAAQAALAIRRRGEDRTKEGDDPRWLSRLFWFAGRRADAEIAGYEAVRTLETEPPGPELAMAYSNLSQLAMLAFDLDGAAEWGNRAVALAADLGERETFIHARTNVGTARLQAGDPAGRDELERAAAEAAAAGLTEHAARALTNLAWVAVTDYDLATAERAIRRALAYATEHDLDHYRRYLLAQTALLHLRRGEWDGARVIDIREPDEATTKGRIPGAVPAPRGMLEFYADPTTPYHCAEFEPGKRIILACASGGRSALGAATLQKMGYSNVAHLDGGLNAWIAQGLPVETPTA